MATFRSRLVSGTSLSLILSAGLAVVPVQAQETGETTVLEEIVLTAEEQAKSLVARLTTLDEKIARLEDEIERLPTEDRIAEITGALDAALRVGRHEG